MLTKRCMAIPKKDVSKKDCYSVYKTIPWICGEKSILISLGVSCDRRFSESKIMISYYYNFLIHPGWSVLSIVVQWSCYYKAFPNEAVNKRHQRSAVP